MSVAVIENGSLDALMLAGAVAEDSSSDSRV